MESAEREILNYQCDPTVLKQHLGLHPVGLLTCNIDILLLSSDGQVDPPSLLCMVLAAETGNTGLTPSMDIHVTTSQHKEYTCTSMNKHMHTIRTLHYLYTDCIDFYLFPRDLP